MYKSCAGIKLSNFRVGIIDGMVGKGCLCILLTGGSKQKLHSLIRVAIILFDVQGDLSYKYVQGNQHSLYLFTELDHEIASMIL